MPGGYGRGRRHRRWFKRTGKPGWLRSNHNPGYNSRTFENGREAPMPREHPPYEHTVPYPRGVPEDELQSLKGNERAMEAELGYIKMRIEELKEFEADNTIGEVCDSLPKQNCGACGYQTCLDCARAIVMGYAPPDSCVMADNEIMDRIEDALYKKEKEVI